MQTMRWSKKMSFVLVFICCTQDASFGSVQVYLCRIMHFKFATASRCIKKFIVCSYNASKCVICKFATVSNRITKCIAVFLHLIAMLPKQGKGRKARAMGWRWLSKSVSLSLEWGAGWNFLGKKSFCQHHHSARVSVFSNAKLSKLQVRKCNTWMHWSGTNTECCICVARKMQIFLA